MVIDASVAVEYLVTLTLTERAQAVSRATTDRDIELWVRDRTTKPCWEGSWGTRRSRTAA